VDLAVFKQRVGQRLGVVPTAGSLSPEDGEVIGGAYVTLLQELGEHGLAWWNPDRDVPEQFADVLIGMVAAAVVDDFTIPEPRRSQLILMGAFGVAPATMGERRLRAMARVANDGEPAEATYY
jgi:hypothetical protein